MDTFRNRALLFSLVLALVVLACPAPADSRAATVKFDTWVEVPGMVLPGGTYIFVLADNKGAEHHVQIFDMVTRRLVAVVATDPDQVDHPQEDNVRFETRDGPFRGQAVAEWFRPGSRVGERFVYQPGMMIGEATMLATNEDLDHPAPTPAADLSQASPLATTPQLSGQSPDQIADQTASNNTRETPPARESVPQPQTLQQNPSQVADNTAPTLNAQQQTPAVPDAAPSAGIETPAGTPETLPKTASHVPLIAIAGMLTLAAAVALRAFLRA